MTAPHNPNDLDRFPSDVSGRAGGPVPLFLKLTMVGVAIFAVVYFAVYHGGDGSALVEAFNAATRHAP